MFLHGDMSSFEENYRFLNSKKNRKIMLFFLLKIDLFLFFFENLIGYNKGGLSEIYSQVFMCVCVFLLCVCVCMLIILTLFVRKINI